jgi:glycosyltransferase involved in cell wall biosynthesis
LRILLIDQYGDLGGGQRCLIEAAEGFAARGWEVFAAVPPGPLTAALAGSTKTVHRLACGPFRPTRKSFADGLLFAAQLPSQIATLRRILNEERIDAIYVNGSQVLPAAAMARGGRPVLFHVHWVVTQAAAARLAGWAMKASRASVIATSQFVARSIQPLVDRKRLRVVYNGVSQNHQPPAAQREARHVAIIGRVAPEKGQLEFVKAVRMVRAEFPDLRFTVCGAPLFSRDGYAEQVREQAHDLGIEFPGWIDNIPKWLRGVDLLVVPSQETDNVPRVILEAFAAGVPVVAFPSGGIPELIEHGVTGLLTSERTPESLAETLAGALAAPQRLRQLSANARARWEQRFTLKRFQSDLCDTVEELLRLHHQAAPSLSAGSRAKA